MKALGERWGLPASAIEKLVRTLAILPHRPTLLREGGPRLLSYLAGQQFPGIAGDWKRAASVSEAKRVVLLNIAS